MSAPTLGRYFYMGSTFWSARISLGRLPVAVSRTTSATCFPSGCQRR